MTADADVDLTGGPYKELRVRRQGRVLRVELNTPDSGNALSAAVLDDLLALLNGLHDQPDIGVLILSGAGEDFCVGADRHEFTAALAADPGGAALRSIGDKARRVCDALESTHVVTIARLHGKIYGAGLALAAFCDLRAGADACQFRMPEIALGVAPAWGGALTRLISEVGAARIRELVLTCEAFGAATAHRLAILHKVARAEDLDSDIDAWVRPLTRRSPEALAVAKIVLTAQSRAARLIDGTLLDAHLLTAQQAAHRT
jgi:methylglutaconyl-CoA hydratase